MIILWKLAHLGLEYDNIQDQKVLFWAKYGQIGQTKKSKFTHFTLFLVFESINNKGNGFCNDVNNNEGCEYDGGDCCGSDVNTTYCSVCQCLDPIHGGGGSAVKVCNGIDFDSECCSTCEKCCINQGDCDSDNECSGALVCGEDNCPSPFPPYADCCENPGPGNFSLMILKIFLMKL